MVPNLRFVDSLVILLKNVPKLENPMINQAFNNYKAIQIHCNTKFFIFDLELCQFRDQD